MDFDVKEYNTVVPAALLHRSDILNLEYGILNLFFEDVEKG